MRYHAIARAAFRFYFLASGVAHLVLDHIAPKSYAVFDETAPFNWLSALWSSFVMPNISWRTLILAAFVMAAGAALCVRDLPCAGARWSSSRSSSSSRWRATASPLPGRSRTS